MKPLKRIFFTLTMILVPALLQCQEQELEKLHESVSVVNIEMVFRAYQKGQPVSGLKKEELILLVNGKPKEINGFFEKRKKVTASESVKTTAGEQASPAPRLYVLIFNISDYQLEIEKSLEYFFDKILRPNDRLIMMSNSFFLNDHAVTDPRAEKAKLKMWLQTEIKKTRQVCIVFRQKLLSLLNDTRNQMQDAAAGAMDVEEVRRNFINDYRQYLKEYRQFFINFSIDQYIKLADYLQRQNVEKWVFNFFEINNFFVPRVNSSLDDFLSGSDIYPEMRRDLDIADNIKERDVGKYFINCGATFHSLFMTHRDRMPVGVSQDNQMQLERMKIASDTENVFTQVTKLTGGIEVDSSKVETFYQRVSESEDIYYVLTFVPDQSAKEQQVTLLSRGKEHDLVYDDQKRSGFIKDIVKERQKDLGEVKISDMKYLDGLLNLKLLTTPAPSAERKRKIRLNIQVVSKSMKLLFNRKKDLDIAAPECPLQVKLPALSRGAYNLIVEASDLESGKNDISFLEFVSFGPVKAGSLDYIPD